MRVLAEQQGEPGGHVDGPVGGLLRDGLVDGRLEALDVQDEVGLGDLGDLRGAELEVVRLDARGRQDVTSTALAADLLGGVLQRVERGDDDGAVAGYWLSRCSSRRSAASDDGRRGRGRRPTAECRVTPRALGLMKMIVKVRNRPRNLSTAKPMTTRTTMTRRIFDRSGDDRPGQRGEPGQDARPRAAAGCRRARRGGAGQDQAEEQQHRRA